MAAFHLLYCTILLGNCNGSAGLESASWVWKSIWGGKELIDKGMRHRVGDGKTIQVWKDKWIPGYEEGTVKSARKEGCSIERVEEPITEGEWNQRQPNRWFD